LGSLLGAWLGAGWATRMHSTTLHKMIAPLLVAIAVVLLFGHEATGSAGASLQGWQLWIAGAVAGLAIGAVASLLGVAGGEHSYPPWSFCSASTSSWPAACAQTLTGNPDLLGRFLAM